MTHRRKCCSMMLVGSFAAALTVVVGACSTSVTPPTSGDGGTDGPVSFAADIQPIFTANCAGCHRQGGIADSAGIPTRLLEGVAYDMIVGVSSVQLTNFVLVVPGDSEASMLYLKVSSISPPVGSRMPLFGPVLSDADIALIQAWIDQGAENN